MLVDAQYVRKISAFTLTHKSKIYNSIRTTSIGLVWFRLTPRRRGFRVTDAVVRSCMTVPGAKVTDRCNLGLDRFALLVDPVFTVSGSVLLGVTGTVVGSSP